MRLIDAEKFEVFDATCQITKVIRSGKTAAYFYGEGCRKVLEAIDAAPTIDPESMRPTAHIMRGTVHDTYDNAFCSSCRSCLNGDEYFEEVLAHRYKYCPYCGKRLVSAYDRLPLPNPPEVTP